MAGCENDFLCTLIIVIIIIIINIIIINFSGLLNVLPRDPMITNAIKVT